MRVSMVVALLMLAGCERAERAIGSAIGPKKAIAELPRLRAHAGL